MSARFGELLLNRRRELGLSIQQVANTIKIRPQIIEYFELGNFAAMPPRGYAQGMISSYARFLGLNPTEVVNIYFDDLCAYEQGGERRGGNLQGAAGQVSPRSSNEAGRFYMVGSQPRVTRYGQRALQAGYVTETGSGNDIRAQRDRVRRTLPPADASVPMAAGTARNPRAGYGDGAYSSGERGRARNTRLANGNRSARGSRSPYPNGRAQGSSRAARSSQSCSQRRRPTGSANGRRPMPRDAYRDRDGRRAPATRGRGGRRDVRSQRGGSSSSFLSSFDPKFLIGAAVVVLAIVILLFVLVSRACSSHTSSTTLAQETAKTETAAQKGSSKKSSAKKKKSSAADDGGDSGDSSDDASADSDSTDSDTTDADSSGSDSDLSSDASSSSITVKVKVASKKTAFLEVRVDGKLVFGKQATGPLTKEFTATESIDITTSKPSYVTITRNGKKVRYDSTAAGVARVSLAVPKKSSTSTSDDSSSSDSSTGSQDSSSASSDQSSSSTTGSSVSSTSSTTSTSS